VVEEKRLSLVAVGRVTIRVADDDYYHESLEVDDNDADDNNDMPSSWFAVVDPNSGDVYYCNEITGETTWDKPSSIRPSSRKEWDGKGGMIG
jgi:hypothetical protein